MGHPAKAKSGQAGIRRSGRAKARTVPTSLPKRRIQSHRVPVAPTPKPRPVDGLPEAADNVTVTILTGSPALDRLSAGAEFLDCNAQTPFQTAQWIVAAVDPEQFVLASATDPFGNLIGMLPMSVGRRFGVTIAQGAGGCLAEYGDFVVAADADRAAIFRALIRALQAADTIDVLCLNNLRNPEFLAHNGLDCPIRFPQWTRAPYVDLQACRSMEDYNRRINPKTRKDRRRARRALEKLGPVEFRVIDAGAEAARLVHTAIEAKRAQLARLGATSSLFRNAVAQDRLVRLAAMTDSDLKVGVLSVGAVPAAMEIGYVRGRAYFSYIGVMNPDFAKCGPGKVQMEDTVAWCMANGYERIDLLPPEDRYKMSWTGDATFVSDVAISLTSSGRAFSTIYLGCVRPAIARIFSWLPRRFREVLVSRTGRRATGDGTAARTDQTLGAVEQFQR